MPDNGFLRFAKMSREEIEAYINTELRPKAPPAPPAKKAAAAAPKLELDFIFNDLKLADFTTEKEQAFLAAVAAKLGVDASRISIKGKAKGSTILQVEVAPATGQTEIPASEIDMVTGVMESEGAALSVPGVGTAQASVADPAAGATSNNDVGPFPAPVVKKVEPLGDTIIGLPRVDPITGSKYEGGFEITNTDYLSSLGMCGAPGIGMGIALLIVMILMLVVKIISLLGGLCCKCCNGAFKPRPYTARSILITKGVMGAFVIVTAAGCFMIYANGPVLLDSVSDTTGAMADSINELTANVTKIADALTGAAKTITEMSDAASSGADLKKAAATVNDVVADAETKIAEYIELGASFILLVSAVVLGLAVLGLLVVLVGWYRLLIAITVLVSLVLIITWICFGVFSVVVVLIDDLNTSMKDYVKSPESSDLSSLIPCIEPNAALDTMKSSRGGYRDAVIKVNEELRKFAGAVPNPGGGVDGNPYVTYLCYNYARTTVQEMCDAPLSPYYKEPYAQFACDGYRNGKVVASKEVLPQEKCPYPTGYHKNQLGEFRTVYEYLRCPFKSTMDDGSANQMGLASCLGVRQIPYDLWDTAADLADAGQLLVNVFPEIEALIQCSMVTNTFAAMNGPVGDMVTALNDLWTGLLLVGVAYFSLWVIQIVATSRLMNKSMQTDGAEAAVDAVGKV